MRREVARWNIRQGVYIKKRLYAKTQSLVASNISSLSYFPFYDPLSTNCSSSSNIYSSPIVPSKHFNSISSGDTIPSDGFRLVAALGPVRCAALFDKMNFNNFDPIFLSKLSIFVDSPVFLLRYSAPLNFFRWPLIFNSKIRSKLPQIIKKTVLYLKLSINYFFSVKKQNKII